MLLTLRIKNLALVEDLTLELQPGFNAITGETGAGKSIILGALSLLLGDRADRALIRSGSEGCSVEAVFDISKSRAVVAGFLEENGIDDCEENQLFIKRSISTNGSNRQFINGSPVSLQILGRLGEWLVDIHGPHDHQSLLQNSRQLQILDAYGHLHPVQGRFRELVARRQQAEQQKKDLVVDERTYAQQLELLRFQVHEIKTARLTAADESNLEHEYHRAANAVRLLQIAQSLHETLSESEQSLLQGAAQLGRQLQELRRIDPGTEAYLNQQEQLTSLLQELSSGISNYIDDLEIDPARLQELEERINLLQSLKKKYGSTVEEILQHGKEAAEKLARLESREVELEKINLEITRLDRELLSAGNELSDKRKKLIPNLCKAVGRELQALGFKQSQFGVELHCRPPQDLSLAGAAGFDAIEFVFAPNPGEPARPLKSIASSGEMARVMLALKTVLAQVDEVPVLLFDEVDANVGGETAQAVGKKMREIGKEHQVLCITHLAPVAACAQAHYVVEKRMKEGRTISVIEALTQDHRIKELARMLGGKTAAALQHAASLLEA